MSKLSRALIVASCILVFPALGINLGLPVLIDDEGIRSLVALEMMYSGNFITPSLHGVYYFNKPPLYNWWLTVFFRLFGQSGEWVVRLPTLVALVGFAATVFLVFRREFREDAIAFLGAFSLITCGRILFWDSMLGLIDMTFSWVIFLLFYSVFFYFRRAGWWSLFILAYLLGAIGFLLKGLPAIVFLGGTLLPWFLYKRSLQKFVSLPHLAGLGVFTVIVGGYYLAYYLQNPDLDQVFRTLLTETTKRTVVNQGLAYTLQHLITFPFEMTYHFLPWSLLILFFVRKSVWREIRSEEFVFFCLLLFLVNILPYWTAPRTHPRYLLMFIPLVFGPALYLGKKHAAERTVLFRGFYVLFGSIISLTTLASLAPFFLRRVHDIPFWQLKTAGLILAIAALSWLYWKHPSQLWKVVVLFLLVLRIGFNWFILPERLEEDPARELRVKGELIGKNHKTRPLYLYQYDHFEPALSYYLTRERGAIIPLWQGNAEANAHFLIYSDGFDSQAFRKVDSLYLRHSEGFLYLAEPRD